MTTFKVYFICSAPKAVWALGREIVIYSKVHLIMLCNRETRRGDTLYIGSIWFKQSKQREMEKKRERTDSHLLKGCNYKPFCLMDDKSFCNEWIERLKGESEWSWLAYCVQNNSHYWSIMAKKKKIHTCRLYIENMQSGFLSYTLINLDLRVGKCISIPFHKKMLISSMFCQALKPTSE